MEVSQVAFALFCAAALVGGAFIGVLYDAFAVLPVACGKAYAPRLHARLKGVRMPYPLGEKRSFIRVAVFWHDLFAMLVAGVLLVLITYRFNDGQGRVAAPICFLFGYLIYRAAFRRFVLPISELSGFVFRYILSISVFLLALPIKLCVRLWRSIERKRLKRYISNYTAQKKRELVLSAEANGCFEELNKNGKKKNESNNNTRDSRNAHPFGDTDGGEHNAVQSKAKRGGKARGRAR